MDTDLRDTVNLAASGDRAAFDSLFARNMPALKAFLRVRVGPALAARESLSDLAQSVCREVLVDIEDFEYRGEHAFRKWLLTQAARKIVDRRRYWDRDRRDGKREVAAAAQPDSSSSKPSDCNDLLQAYATICTPSRHVAADEEIERIENAIRSLPEDQRDAVTMSRILGLGREEIADRMQRSETSVRGLIARGLATLSARIGPQD